MLYLRCAGLYIVSIICLVMTTGCNPQKGTNNNHTLYLHPHLLYWVDQENRTEQTDKAKVIKAVQKLIAQKKFKAHPHSFGSLDYRVWGAWINPAWPKSFQPEYFVFNNERMENTNLYFLYSDNSFQYYHYDNSVPFYKRVIPQRKLIFPLKKRNKIRAVYFNVMTKELVSTASYLADGVGLGQMEFNTAMFNGAFYGILIAMFFYNFIMMFFIRNKSYLYYILFIFFHIVSQASFDGIIHQFIFPQNYVWARNLRVYTGGAVVLFSLLFLRNFLEIEKYSKKLNLLIRICMGGLAINLLVQMVFGFLAGAKTLQYILLVYAPLAIFIGASLLKKNPMAKWYLMSWVPLLSGVLIQMLKPLGIYFPLIKEGNYPLQIGHLSEAIILSLALGYRFKLMRESIESKDHELLKSRMNNLKDKLKPHFVLNTLSMILWFIKKDKQLAEKSLKSLAQSYRFLLKHSEQDLIRLESEIFFARHYTEILRRKYPSTLKISFEVEGPVSKIMIPPLTIQPLIENAYKHGVRKLKRGQIETHIKTVKNTVKIKVSNSAAAGQLPAGIFDNTTIGSIKKRMEHFFPGSAFTVEKKKNLTTVLVVYQN